jgi:hypothetical protein
VTGKSGNRLPHSKKLESSIWSAATSRRFGPRDRLRRDKFQASSVREGAESPRDSDARSQ